MVPKFTLVPSELFDRDNAEQYLKEVVPLAEGEPLSFLEVPSEKAFLVFAGDSRPVVYDMLLSLCKIREYNKIVFDLRDGVLSLVVAIGDSLALCNAFPADTFITAQYYIFLTLKRLQINPQLSTIFSMGEMDASQLLSLCRYFKNAEVLK